MSSGQAGQSLRGFTRCQWPQWQWKDREPDTVSCGCRVGPELLSIARPEKKKRRRWPREYCGAVSPRRGCEGTVCFGDSRMFTQVSCRSCCAKAEKWVALLSPDSWSLPGLTTRLRLLGKNEDPNICGTLATEEGGVARREASGSRAGRRVESSGHRQHRVT